MAFPFLAFLGTGSGSASSESTEFVTTGWRARLDLVFAGADGPALPALLEPEAAGCSPLSLLAFVLALVDEAGVLPFFACAPFFAGGSASLKSKLAFDTGQPSAQMLPYLVAGSLWRGLHGRLLGFGGFLGLVILQQSDIQHPASTV